MLDEKGFVLEGDEPIGSRSTAFSTSGAERRRRPTRSHDEQAESFVAQDQPPGLVSWTSQPRYEPEASASVRTMISGTS